MKRIYLTKEEYSHYIVLCGLLEAIIFNQFYSKVLSKNASNKTAVYGKKIRWNRCNVQKYGV